MGQRGDERRDREFAAFVHGHHTELYRAAFLLCGHRETAADLVQTALTRLYVHWDRVGGQEPLAYVRRILINAHTDSWRRSRGREVVLDSVPEPVDRDVRTDHADTSAERYAVVAALDELTERERRVVVLRFLLDRSEAETAAELDIPVGTVKSTTNRAITKLRSSAHLSDAATVKETS